jgi:hypothetical protein
VVLRRKDTGGRAGIIGNADRVEALRDSTMREDSRLATGTAREQVRIINKDECGEDDNYHKSVTKNASHNCLSTKIDSHFYGSELSSDTHGSFEANSLHAAKIPIKATLVLLTFATSQNREFCDASNISYWRTPSESAIPNLAEESLAFLRNCVHNDRLNGASQCLSPGHRHHLLAVSACGSFAAT